MSTRSHATTMGLLVGTLLSGAVYQAARQPACLWLSSGFFELTLLITIQLARGR
ncbi:MAG: hypothetical protein U5L02_01590 [Rheinheimera sp.]|nr:hypothetical protein [Rheinheimera sp.]